MANNLIDKDGKLNQKEYNKKVKKQQETFAKIDATMAILEKMPELTDVGLDFLNADSFTYATNPLEFLFNILKSLGVTEDQLKKWITDILTQALPAIEIGVKGFLLAQIKSIISCNYDPRIPYYLRKKSGTGIYYDVISGAYGEDGRGVDISLSAIDPEGMLDLSPFTEPGSQYYFGQSEDINEDSNSKIAKLARADDFNAFLWYVIHKGNRQNPIKVNLNNNGTFTYNGKTYTATTNGETASSSMKGVLYVKYPFDTDEVTGKIKNTYEFIAGTTFCDANDQKEILICIYKDDLSHTNTLVPISSEWKSCSWYVDKSQYYNNNIVGRGDDDSNTRNYHKEKPICNLAYTDLASYKGKSVKPPVGLDNIWFTILPKPAVILPTTTEAHTSWRIVRLLFDADGTPNSKGKYSLPGETTPTRREDGEYAYYKYGNAEVIFNLKTGKYEFANKSIGAKALVECYPGLTVYEFNYDYIMGMKLFDTKTVLNRILNSATNSKYTANFSLTLNKQKVKSNYPFISTKQRVTEIVRKILESDEEEYNDCFYSFSNNDYDEMLQKTAELKYHQSPYTEGYTDGHVIDLSSVDKILADYPENGTLQEQKDIVSNAIEAACASVEDTMVSIYGTDYGSSKSSIRINFLTNILQQLALCVVDCIMSPKILMLLAVNNLLMNDDEEYPLTTEQLMQMAKNVVTSLIKEVRDLIMQKILDYIIEFLKPMILEIQAFIVSEQFAAYMAIIKLLLAWFNKGLITATRLNAVLSSMLSKFKNGNYSEDGINYDIPSILDDVNYADIYKSDIPQEEPIINNC